MSPGIREPRFSFQMLLGSFVLLIFIPGSFYGETDIFVSRFLSTLTLVACLYIVVYRRKDFVVGLLLALPTIVTDWAPVWFASEQSQLLAYSFFKILFFSYIVYHIFKYLIAARQVDANIISAAICLYLLTGMTWALIYFAVVMLDPLAINLQIELVATRESATALMQELIYFSYVTQTTLGYGEITPATGIARALVIAQSLFGQIYIAVVIARLVGLQIATATIEESNSSV